MNQSLDPLGLRVLVDVESFHDDCRHRLNLFNQLESKVLRDHWTAFFDHHVQKAYCRMQNLKRFSIPSDFAVENLCKKAHRDDRFSTWTTNDHSCWGKAHCDLLVTSQSDLNLRVMVQLLIFLCWSKWMSCTTIKEPTKARTAHP